jgi:alpha-mannosidase
VEPLVSVDDDRVVIEAVKLADDRSGDVVVRLYEAAGGRAETRLTATFAVAAAHETDLLERPVADLGLTAGTLTVQFRPFQVRTLRLAR